MPVSHAPDSDFLALQEALAGRYSLERELGRGGMGIVYLAQDVGLDRPVALKLLPPRYAVHPALRERFIREARTAARLSHPHIVPIHLVDEVGEFVFFVMTFVEGETLGQRVRARGPLSPREATRVLREVAWALAYAHAQGVVHRDIKPDNILLEAGSGRALVTDFGIARAGESAGLTTVNEILGTPEYMSPEQASGEPVDGRSDLYSLGVVGHYILTGKPPLQGASAQATLAKVLTQPAPALSTTAPEVPAALAAAMDRCLAKSPAERFEGGEELADTLGSALRDRREIPAAIRVFQEQNRESNSVVMGLLMIMVLMTAVVVVGAGSGEMELVEIVWGLAGVLLWWLVPVAMLGAMARRLLRAGYGHDELVGALGAEVEERRREVAPRLATRDGPVDALARTAAIAGFGILTGAVVLLLVPDVSEAWIRWGFTGGAVLGFGGGILGAVRNSFHKPVSGERWLGFWESLFGRALFRLARIGLGARSAAGGSYRPTELAIGMAAERLFDELPKEVRRSLGDLPGVVGMLEEHAERMRARVHELDRLLAELGGAGAAAPSKTVTASERHGAVAADVRAARDAAERRLRDVVAALEGLRLELLHLHAGSGTVESVTEDLSAARALSDDVARLLDGQHEVEALLRPERTADTPLPA